MLNVIIGQKKGTSNGIVQQSKENCVGPKAFHSSFDDD